MLRHYFKKTLLAIVLYGYILAQAGSYEDFFLAIRQDDAKTIQELLRRGFDPNVPDPKGQFGLVLALREKSLKVTDALLDSPRIKVEVRTAADENPLMFAALDGHLEVVRKLVEKGADVNKPGWTPLHYAATRGHVAVMNLLLENHAYIDAASPNNTTPLMMAAFYGTPSAVKVLLEAGADPMLKNDLGLTAIDFAHRNSRQESADLIAAFVRARQPKGKW